MKYSPHDYQKEAIKFLLSNPRAGLFLDPGLGKTSITYATFKILRSQGLVKKMLVIAPLRPANSVWPREAQKWDEFRDLNVCVLHGPDKNTLLERDYDVYIINPAGLPWLFERLQGRESPFEMLVVDESTQFKHTNTERFKVLKRMLTGFKRRYILTGSPAPNGLLDLYGQIFLLDMGAALGKTFYIYRGDYFNKAGWQGFNHVLRDGAADQIYEKIAPLTLRMAAKDYLTLPPLIFNVVEVDLPSDARKIYDEMEDLMITQIESDTVVAANAASVSMKCRQIANGGIYVEAPEFRHIHAAKSEAASDLVDELGGKPALIAYEFAHDLDRLRTLFPGAPHLGGGISAHRQREIEDAWNSGSLPVLLAQPQSVAHGLNLQGVGAAIIGHSLTWNLENDEQLVRRVWRQGQTERVVVHRIVARRTVDEVILRALAKKDHTQQSLLEALKEYALLRKARGPVQDQIAALQ